MSKIGFKKIDEEILKQIEVLQSTSFYNQFNEKLSYLDEFQQKLVNIGLNTLFLVIPIIATFIIFLSNYSLKSEIDVKEQIIVEINKVQDKQKEVNSLKRSVVSRDKISSESDFTSTIKKDLTAKGIEDKKISFENYEEVKSTKNIRKSKGRVNFKSFTNSDLNNLLSVLLSKSKFKANKIQINRESSGEFIKGFVELINFSGK